MVVSRRVGNSNHRTTLSWRRVRRELELLRRLVPTRKYSEKQRVTMGAGPGPGDPDNINADVQPEGLQVTCPGFVPRIRRIRDRNADPPDSPNPPNRSYQSSQSSKCCHPPNRAPNPPTRNSDARILYSERPRACQGPYVQATSSLLWLDRARRRQREQHRAGVVDTGIDDHENIWTGLASSHDAHVGSSLDHARAASSATNGGGSDHQNSDKLYLGSEARLYP